MKPERSGLHVMKANKGQTIEDIDDNIKALLDLRNRLIAESEAIEPCFQPLPEVVPNLYGEEYQHIHKNPLIKINSTIGND